MFDLLRKGYYKLQNRRIDRVGNNIAGSVEPVKGAIYCNKCEALRQSLIQPHRVTTKLHKASNHGVGKYWLEKKRRLGL